MKISMAVSIEDIHQSYLWILPHEIVVHKRLACVGLSRSLRLVFTSMSRIKKERVQLIEGAFTEVSMPGPELLRSLLQHDLSQCRTKDIEHELTTALIGE